MIVENGNANPPRVVSKTGRVRKLTGQDGLEIKLLG